MASRRPEQAPARGLCKPVFSPGPASRGGGSRAIVIRNRLCEARERAGPELGPRNILAEDADCLLQSFPDICFAGLVGGVLRAFAHCVLACTACGGGLHIKHPR
jgi:hypothetical protein